VWLFEHGPGVWADVSKDVQRGVEVMWSGGFVSVGVVMGERAGRSLWQGESWFSVLEQCFVHWARYGCMGGVKLCRI
jgi:hypothetical protein